MGPSRLRRVAADTMSRITMNMNMRMHASSGTRSAPHIAPNNGATCMPARAHCPWGEGALEHCSDKTSKCAHSAGKAASAVRSSAAPCVTTPLSPCLAAPPLEHAILPRIFTDTQKAPQPG
eukprot:811874-Prorocentrum_minimum.AAC.1